MMLRLLSVAVILFLSFGVGAQYKTYKIGVKGDTLNAVDMQGRKQGKWIVQVAALRGEPGYEEEGIFRNDKKEGEWRKFNAVGDLIAVENYKWGNKNGISQYYTIMGALRVESWRAVNPDSPYDTIEVPDPIDPYKVTMQVIKVEGTSVKHGSWKFYDPETGILQRTENWFMGKLQPDKKQQVANAADSSLQIRKKLSDDNKPKEVADYDKKNAGKKQIKVRDGRAGY